MRSLRLLQFLPRLRKRKLVRLGLVRQRLAVRRLHLCELGPRLVQQPLMRLSMR